MSSKKYNIAIVMSQFNKPIVDGLLSGAKKSFSENDGGKLSIYEVPGAFEIPAAVKRVAESKKPDAVVTLGAVIKGDTKHFDYISDACTNGVLNLTLELDIPVMFGVLTTETVSQAVDRSTKNNKGYEVMDAAFDMIRLFEDLKLSS